MLEIRVCCDAVIGGSGCVSVGTGVGMAVGCIVGEIGVGQAFVAKGCS
jgi:hypothetical protein